MPNILLTTFEAYKAIMKNRVEEEDVNGEEEEEHTIL